MITPFETDTALMLCLNGDGGPWVDQIMWFASAKLTWVPLYGAILWWVWRNRGWRYALAFVVVAALMVLCADQTASFCKSHFPKLRPTHYPPLESLLHTVNGYTGGLYGTVSSHAANAAGFALLAALVVRNRLLSYGLIFWVLLVSYSRIYLGAHYPMDILLGLIEGAIWGALCYLLLRKVDKRLSGIK